MRFEQFALAFNILALIIVLIYQWDVCPYRKKNRLKRSEKRNNRD